MTPYDKRNTDPVLAAMSHRLDAIRFPQSVVIPSTTKYRNCYLHAISGNFYVKFSVGGKQRTVGVTKIGSGGRERAIRFTDMFSLYFWKYRHPGRTPSDADFNLSLAQAEEDLKTCEGGLVWLQAIEKHWLAQGIISDRPIVTDTLTPKQMFSKSQYYWNQARRIFFSLPEDARTKFVLETIREKSVELEKLFESYNRLLSTETESQFNV